MKLDLSKRAGKFLRTLPPKQFRQVTLSILALGDNPDPQDAQPLKGSDYLRIDVGEYRVVYRVEGDTLKIALVGKRNDSDVYRQLSQLGK